MAMPLYVYSVEPRKKGRWTMWEGTTTEPEFVSLCCLAASIPVLLKRFQIRAQAATVYVASFAEKRVDGAM